MSDTKRDPGVTWEDFTPEDPEYDSPFGFLGQRDTHPWLHRPVRGVEDNVFAARTEIRMHSEMYQALRAAARDERMFLGEYLRFILCRAVLTRTPVAEREIEHRHAVPY